MESEEEYYTLALPKGYVLKDKFRILGVLGHGGFAITYLAEDLDLNRRVVVKESLPLDFADRDLKTCSVRPIPSMEDTAESLAWALQNFINEARTLASLTHPHVVAIHDVFEANKTAYYVMPYEGGVSLSAWLGKKPVPTPEEVRLFLSTMLEAMSYLHEHHLLHRDIKPDNILMTPKGPVLIDFGNARVLTSKRTHTRAYSPGYAPLEQVVEQVVEQGQTGTWTDVYGLGATLYRMLVGVNPPDVLKRLGGEGKDPITLLSRDRVLTDIFGLPLLRSIDKALAVEPKGRWQTMADWQHALENPPRWYHVLKSRQVQYGMAIAGTMLTMFVLVPLTLSWVTRTDVPVVQAEEPLLLPEPELPIDQETLDAELWAAATAGDASRVRRLLAAEANVMIRGEAERTPLHQAAAAGHTDVARLLLDAGAAVDATDALYKTPLHLAAQAGQTDVARLLLERGANYAARDIRNHYPMLLASAKGHAAMVDLLPISQAQWSAWNLAPSPLHMAARGNHTEMLRELVGRGAYVDVWDPLGATSLMYAAYMGHKDAVIFLLEKGANPNHRSRLTGLTCADYARMGGHAEVIRILESAGMNSADAVAESTPLLVATAMNDNHRMAQLLREGADPNATCADQITPLHVAAMLGYEAAARLLLKSGAQLETPMRLGYTPLHKAAQSGHAALAQLLLENKAKVACVNDAGEMPLHLAALCGHVPTVRLLLEHGAPVRARTHAGKSALALAAVSGHLPVVNLLLEYGALAHQTENTMYVPLHQAAWGGHPDVALLLLSRGAEINQVDATGRTPLAVAAYRGHEEVVKLLLDKGASVYCAPGSSFLPVHVAAQGGYNSIINLLLEHGADVQQVDASGRTALYEAVLHNHAQTVKLLVNRGADATICPATDGSLLHVAARNGEMDILTFLLERGVDVSARDSEGRTAWDVAGDNCTPVSLQDTMRRRTRLLLQEYGAEPTGEGAEP